MKSLIERQKTKYGWEFIFLGANIDAVETAGRFGIAPDRAQRYHSDGEGTQLNYRVVSKAVASFRAAPAGTMLDSDWADEIQSDFKKRGGGR